MAVSAHDLLTAGDREQVFEAMTALAMCDYIHTCDGTLPMVNLQWFTHNGNWK